MHACPASPPCPTCSASPWSAAASQTRVRLGASQQTSLLRSHLPLSLSLLLPPPFFPSRSLSLPLRCKIMRPLHRLMRVGIEWGKGMLCALGRACGMYARVRVSVPSCMHA